MQQKASTESDNVLNPFVQKHHADVIGVLRGFDRLRLAGTFRALYHPPVMEKYIQKTGFLLKDFKQLMLQITGQIKAATQQIAQRAGRPLTYLSSSQVRKEQVAREIAQKDGVSSGLIAILSCVEPCRTYTVGGNPQSKMLEAHLGLGKCLHYYFYHFHPVFGFMHLRLQSWFPFLIHICLNGRNWLARQRTAQLYPRLVHHGIKSFGSRDVLRFLGHKPPANGVGKFAGELHSRLKHRTEGLRIKHFVNGNSLKLYDKQGSVLRVETTINHPEEFKVWRARENDPEQKKAWCELRRGVADLPRHAHVSHAANERYLRALAVVDEQTPL